MRIKIIVAFVILTNFFHIEQTSYGANTEEYKKQNTQEPQEAIEPPEAPVVLFFTTYNAGSVDQNDSDPCHSASGIDICTGLANGKKYIALTKDIRASMDIKFGQSVTLTGGKCAGTYIVADEMGKRFRESCIKKAGYCKK